jgi:hypothetical protein
VSAQRIVAVTPAAHHSFAGPRRRGKLRAPCGSRPLRQPADGSAITTHRSTHPPVHPSAGLCGPATTTTCQNGPLQPCQIAAADPGLAGEAFKTRGRIYPVSPDSYKVLSRASRIQPAKAGGLPPRTSWILIMLSTAHPHLHCAQHTTHTTQTGCRRTNTRSGMHQTAPAPQWPVPTSCPRTRVCAQPPSAS